MASYSYIAANKTGRELKGTLEADSPEKAIAQVKSAGNTIISIHEAGILSRDLELSLFQPKPKPRDMSVFCRQFVSIIEAGVPVISALEMLGEQTENKMLREAIVWCKQSIERGSSLAAAMRERPRVFTSIFVKLVEAGEASGSLANSFTRMAEQFEKQHRLSSLVKKATIYPVILMIVTLIVIAVLLTFVVPTFESMLTDLGTELPALTKAVLAASTVFQHVWYIILAVTIAVVLGIRAFYKTENGKYFFARLQMKLPLFGKLAVKTGASQFARTMSTLLSAGIPMIDALEITAGTMSNILFRNVLTDARDDVAMGTDLSEPLRNAGVFPTLVYHMIGVGEEAGDIDGMLSKLADYYGEEVEEATQQVMAALEPMIIIIMAGVVGTIIMSVMLPMANMYSALGNL